MLWLAGQCKEQAKRVGLHVGLVISNPSLVVTDRASASTSGRELMSRAATNRLKGAIAHQPT
jgi:hypothetical protein